MKKKTEPRTSPSIHGWMECALFIRLLCDASHELVLQSIGTIPISSYERVLRKGAQTSEMRRFYVTYGVIAVQSPRPVIYVTHQRRAELVFPAP